MERNFDLTDFTVESAGSGPAGCNCNAIVRQLLAKGAACNWKCLVSRTSAARTAGLNTTKRSAAANNRPYSPGTPHHPRPVSWSQCSTPLGRAARKRHRDTLLLPVTVTYCPTEHRATLSLASLFMHIWSVPTRAQDLKCTHCHLSDTVFHN